MAGRMCDLARLSFPREYRAIDSTSARVILVEAMDRLLQAYPPVLSARA
jgi:NADH dehydrogenase